jgi:hypothetical protein|tara:strand:+ start:1656 stop:2477 length:822 start_codon:yes stop_codon:yes gene_type:complete
MKRKDLKKLIIEVKDEINKECVAATQDVSLNTANRDRAIQADFIKYGPLNVEEPGDYWKKIAKKWDTDVKAAFKSRCANCVAFDISERMLECIPGSVSEPVDEPGTQKDIDKAFKDKPEVGELVKEGVLGYCWMHHFKCHSARACNTWAAGGPINKDEDSYDWQKRNLKQAIDPEPIDPDLYQDDTEGEKKNESLRNWFKKEDWVRIDTQGNITGACGTMKKGKKTTRCLPRKKAQSLTKKQRAATARKKTKSKKQFVKNTKAAKVSLKKKKK